MTFSEAVRNCFNHYASGKGRATRSEYWWWVLFTVLVGIVAGILDAAVREGFGALAYLAVLLPSVAVGIRRLHDTDRSGRWMFIIFVPIVGGIVLLIFFLSTGTPGPNKYDMYELRSNDLK